MAVGAIAFAWFTVVAPGEAFAVELEALRAAALALLRQWHRFQRWWRARVIGVFDL